MLGAFVALKTMAVVINLWTLITLENPLFCVNFVDMVTFITVVSKVAERMNNFEENYKFRKKIFNIPFAAIVVTEYVFDSILIMLCVEHILLL